MQVPEVLAWLKAHSTKATLDGMARYAIPSHNAYGVAVKDIKALGKKLGRNHVAIVEREAGDRRNFVKKAVQMARRAVERRLAKKR